MTISVEQAGLGAASANEDQGSVALRDASGSCRSLFFTSCISAFMLQLGQYHENHVMKIMFKSFYVLWETVAGSVQSPLRFFPYMRKGTLHDHI